MLDTRMEPAVAKEMVKGAADPLHSEFRLSGPMLLNLTRLESWSPDALLLRSFRQFLAERGAPAQLHKAALLRVCTSISYRHQYRSAQLECIALDVFKYI